MTVRENEPELKPVRAVIFDVFSTLIEIYKPMRHYNALAAKLKRPVRHVRAALDAYVEAFENGTMAAPERMIRATATLGLSLDSQEIEELISIEAASASQACRPYSGVDELLLALRQAGFETGICSNANPIGIAIVQIFGLDQLVSPGAAIFSCRAGAVKPDPLIYHAVTSQLRSEPPECLYIDDGGSRSLVGAADLGMRTVCVHHKDGHSGRHPNDPDIAATYHRSSVMDVAELLDVKIPTQSLSLP